VLPDCATLHAGFWSGLTPYPPIPLVSDLQALNYGAVRLGGKAGDSRI
jgi:hypothetical protein